MARSVDYDVVASYDALIEIYTQVRRSWLTHLRARAL
jgi:hypothetical protein